MKTKAAIRLMASASVFAASTTDAGKLLTALKSPKVLGTAFVRDESSTEQTAIWRSPLTQATLTYDTATEELYFYFSCPKANLVIRADGDTYADIVKTIASKAKIAKPVQNERVESIRQGLASLK